MVKNKFAIIIDSIFISLILFIISFVWISKYIKNAKICIFICIIIFTLAYITIYKLSIKKYKTLSLSLSDKITSQKFKQYLIYSSSKETTKYLCELFNAIQINNSIAKNENSYLYINIHSPLSPTDFNKANQFYLNKNNELPLSFICTEIDEDFKTILNNSPVKYNLFSFNELYLYIKSKNAFPFNFNSNSVSKQSKFKLFKSVIKNSLIKNHFKDFLFSGLSLIAISIFIPYSIYYMIMGSVLLIFSICCLISKSPEPINNKLSLHNISQNNEHKKNNAN